ncbi:MAG: protein translocase subunit SecF [Bdellovibrionales bacterium]|nr:protein translocase subunit SecF [Bdellovibrionales bacterium]
MFEIIKHGTQFDFMSKRKLWAGLSVLFILLTFVLLFTKGLNYGIDFRGGAEVLVKVPAGWDIGKVRNSLSDGGLKNFKVQEIGVPTDSQYLIKTEGDESTMNAVKETVDGIFKKATGGADYRIEKTDVVGAAAGASLRMSGILSMLYALICILIYVAIRFDARYAPGAVVALFHDTVIVVGIFILTQKQFDLQILAAILALIGYSNNDTIIVFDRIREELHANPSMGIVEVVNKSINETLGRTILTSLCTFLTVFSLWVFGGKALEDFAFTLMVGIIVGTYSSIFIASSLVVFITEYQQKRAVAAKSGGSKRKTYTVRPDPKFTA